MKDTVTIIELNQRELIGLCTELTRSQSSNFHIISNLWKKFNSSLHRVVGRSANSGYWEKFGITYKENDRIFYMTAVPWIEEHTYPGSMLRKTIPSGPFAFFEHRGKLMNIKHTVALIFKEYIPANNLPIKDSNSPGIVFLEKYDNRFHWNKVDSVIEIFVPVLALNEPALE
ncbi:MAG: hypothetical protein GY754_00405 [bacterium]|nr:hypothetical protein [bacterium]